MGYNFGLSTTTADGEPVSRYDGFVTRNLSPMLRNEADLVDGIKTIDDLTGQDAMPLCEFALLRVLRDPLGYREMEPDNGFGTYDGLVEMLCKVIQACALNPSGVWWVHG